MTLPDERARAVAQTRDFLRSLCDAESSPDVPAAVRDEARRLLRHYPDDHHLDAAAVAWPDHWKTTASQQVPSPPSYKDLMDLFRIQRGLPAVLAAS